jgi:hypothetical protein
MERSWRQYLTMWGRKRNRAAGELRSLRHRQLSVQSCGRGADLGAARKVGADRQLFAIAVDLAVVRDSDSAAENVDPP